MSIYRPSPVSLALVVALFTLGYTNPSFAQPKNCVEDDPRPSCNAGDDPGLPTGITVQLIDGAFESADNSEIPTFAIVGVTAESETKLNGDDDIHMIRPVSPDPNLGLWNNVFDLCGLLGPPEAVEVPDFTAQGGHKGWKIQEAVNQVWVFLEFPLDSPLDSSDPLYTDKLSAGMQLKGECPSGCILIPDAVEEPMGSGVSILTIELTDYAIHLRGKGGVTHQAECHAGEGPIGATTDLVITRPL